MCVFTLFVCTCVKISLSSAHNVLQLLFQETNPGVRYEYTISRDTLVDSNNGTAVSYFQWVYGALTECSATCGTGKESSCCTLSLSTYAHAQVKPDLLHHCVCIYFALLQFHIILKSAENS